MSDEIFKDFLLSRIMKTRGTRPSDVKADADADWHEQVTLVIGMHPKLSDTQKKVMAFDYGMRGGRTKIKIRKAILYHPMWRVGLDTVTSARLPLNQQIVLQNRNEVLSNPNNDRYVPLRIDK